MINRIYLKGLYFLNQLFGFLFYGLEKIKIIKPIAFHVISAKDDVIQVNHAYPTNYNPQHKILFDEWKTYPTFENKLFFLNDVSVSYMGIVSKGYQCFVPALPHPVFKNKFGFLFNFHQNLFTKKIILSNTSNYFLVHDMWSYANYFHWMIDSLCRLFFWKEQLPQYTLLIHEGAPKYITETLLLFPFKNRIEIPKNTRVVVPNLTVPDFCAWSGQQHPVVLKQVKTLLLNQYNSIEGGFERIYVSRSQQKVRKINNEEAVVKLLKEKGFKVVYFESLSVAEQISITIHAKLFVTSHGANVTNALFMKQGKVLELLRNDKPNFCYWSSITCLDMPYYYQLCEVVNHDDLLVDLVELNKNIDFMLRENS